MAGQARGGPAGTQQEGELEGKGVLSTFHVGSVLWLSALSAVAQVILDSPGK